MTSEPEIVTIEPQTTAAIAEIVPVGEMPAFFDRAFGRLAGAIIAQGAEIAGPAFAYYRSAPSETADIVVGFPTVSPITADGEVEPFTLPGGTVARTVYAGGYDGLGEAWGSFIGAVVPQGFIPSGPIWEVYVVEPSPDMDPADLRTELVLPGSTT